MKRGVAAAAVSALAVTAIPFLMSSASADSVAATTMTAASKDGAAFDDDEFAAGDLTVAVKDQDDNPLTGQSVFYTWNVTPFDTTAGYPKNLPAEGAVDNGDGTYNVRFPAGEPSGTYSLTYYIDNDGTPGQGAGEPTGSNLVVEAGHAELAWKDGATAQAPAEATATFEGSLELEDGTPLSGRDVALSWTASDNAAVAAQGAQPAGTTRTGDTEADAVTKADGTFGVAIADPATPDVNELNGHLDADTGFTPTAALDVDFLKNAGPADVTLTDVELVDGLATPGRPVAIDVTVENADGDALTDYPVTIEVDHGFLSPDATTAADLVPDPVPAEGALYGEWKSDGTEKEYTTDDTGKTGAVVAIEADAAFATGSTVVTTVTVTAGAVAETFPVTFTSTDPLNGGDVRLEPAAEQTVSVLPEAPTSEKVAYDLFVEDQFGNLVDGEQVKLSDDLAGATVNSVDGLTTATSQLANEPSAVTLASSAEGNQEVSADWVVDSNTWRDGVTPGVDLVRDSDDEDTTRKADAAPVEWYDVDYAASDFTMTHDGIDPQGIGSTVVVTYKAVDQEGEPIEGLQVRFFRAGPDDEQDGDGDAAIVTDADGEADYVFQGVTDGTAIIDTVVREPAPSTTIITDAGVNHMVTFGAAKAEVRSRLDATSKGDKDRLTITAPRSARGAKVLIYGLIDGDIVKVAQGRLDNRGKLVKEVRDRNGKKATKYAAIVRATSRTERDVTNVDAAR
ncbi:MAG TPA: hypothetical protein VFO49_19280 [Nocardioides sp.]|nr:hypothetical protein [Nocardioides sp.]